MPTHNCIAMMNKEQRLEVLFDKYVQQSISTEEEQELLALLADASMAGKREELVEKLYDNTADTFMLTHEQANAIFNAIVPPAVATAKPARILSFRWKTWAAAASILLAVAFGAYFILTHYNANQQNQRASHPELLQ